MTEARGNADWLDKRGEAWYYLGPTGRMTKGWTWINGKCYYMDQEKRTYAGGLCDAGRLHCG